MALVSTTLLAGCSQPFNQLQSEQAQIVEVRADANMDVSQCQWKGDVRGSEGHWYTYLFFSNASLTEGAVNEIKIKRRRWVATPYCCSHLLILRRL
ncbi:putative outer membrane lipoprotein [Vibrio variabilis]|uniref:Outer membrane lipoprotein n=1 Tax=Vibrio variabilis TaxID=990271 RepID=A0ABQ0JPB6_9VIBR|nr:putative outer membrane lipoprotein [Vibrio variabilis]